MEEFERKEPMISEEQKEEEGVPFFPLHFMKEVIVALILLALIASLAVLSPLPLHEKADPLDTPEGIKPEWYFLAMYQFIKYFPKVVGILGIGVFMIILVFIPVIDRNPSRNPKKRKVTITLGIIAVILSLFLTFIGHFSERNISILGKMYHIDILGVPHSIEEKK